ncbi:rabenosyn-5-like, partial [Saccoglossus kowalevskii]
MSADSGSDIREGFLCPICMKDLSSVYQLQAHFDDVHSAELGDKDVVHQLKGFFGKAKKKILQKIEGSEAFGAEASQQDEVAGQCSDPSLLDAGGVNPGLWDPQEI